MGMLKTERGFHGSIHYKTVNGHVYWSVRTEQGERVACGVFRSFKPWWQEMAAAALPSARGLGLYAAVLLHLRQELGRPLISDDRLSEANILVWSTIAEVDDKRSRFKINPGPSALRQMANDAGVLSVAQSLVALEVP